MKKFKEGYRNNQFLGNGEFTYQKGHHKSGNVNLEMERDRDSDDNSP